MSDAPGPDDAFGAALYRLLAADGGGLVFSPASIGAALRMALCGAHGQTAGEIAAALGLPGPQAAADGLRLLSHALAELPGDDIIVRAPNTMWVQSGLPVQPGFTATLREAAAVSIRDADFITDWIDRGIPFDERAPEARLLTDHRPAIVYDTENAPVFRPIIVESGRSRSYVVSALVLDNNVVGLLHADHFPVPSRIDEIDRDVLWAFTEGVGYIYERTSLMERLRSQRDQIREILSSTVATMDELCESGMASAGRADSDPAGADSSADFASRPSLVPLAEFTSREQEVFTLMAAGATNNDIAESLVITEGTVKSHVKHILRKLGATNRSQAIAWSIGNRIA